MNKTNFNRKAWAAIASLFAAAVMFAGCGEDGENEDREKMVVMTIYPETGFGSSILSDIWTEPLLFSESDDNQKQMLVNVITEGFDFEYERGYQYNFPAIKVWMANPPMDVSSVKYVFVGPLAKTKVIIHDIEEELQLTVAPHTVKFSPRYPVEYDENGRPKVYDAMIAGINNSFDNNDNIVVKEIEGFEYEVGYKYGLIVKKITTATPYSVRYVLQEVVAKEPAAEE